MPVSSISLSYLSFVQIEAYNGGQIGLAQINIRQIGPGEIGSLQVDPGQDDIEQRCVMA